MPGMIDRRPARPLRSMPALLAAMATERYGVVLADWNLPGHAGGEVLQRVMALPPQQRPRVIVVSGQVDPLVRAQAERAGAAAFLLKPVRMAALVETIARTAPG